MKVNLKNSPQWAKYKARKKLLRKNLIYTPDPSYKRILQDKGKHILKAPEDFSLITNTSLVIGYFRTVLDNSEAGIYSVMDMSAIKRTDLATISLLISVMMDSRNAAQKLRNYTTVYIPPRRTEPGKLFRKAQFHETVTAQGIADHTFFLSRLSTKVNKDYITDVLRYAENFLGIKNPGRLSPLLVEILSNTNNHANPDAIAEDEKLPWFLSVLEDKDTGKIIFSVVDLGVGIFESLRLKGLADTSKFENSIKSFYQNSQYKFLSTSTPRGVDSSTGLSYRGKGLQSIYNYALSANYVKFNIITNRASINLKKIDEEKIDSGESLSGTIYYWEMASNGK